MKPPQLTWWQYFTIGTGRHLSLLGERWGVDWLIYNPWHFRHFHSCAVVNAPMVVDSILATLPGVQTCLDVGSGSGAFAAEFARRGLVTVACERSPTGRRFARRQGVDCRPFDLTKDPPADVPVRFDLVYCFEVAEHLPPELGKRLVEFIAAHGESIVFTAAHPGQGGTGHINEQPKSYWITAFEAEGFAHQQELSDSLAQRFVGSKLTDQWFARNVLVFQAKR